MTACRCTDDAPARCSGNGLPRLANGACSCECHDPREIAPLSGDERLERLCGHDMTAHAGWSRHGVTLSVSRRDGTARWKVESLDLRAAVREVGAMILATPDGFPPREDSPEVHSIRRIRDAARFLPSVEAAARDPRGLVARLWVSTDPADAPEDCRGESGL